MTPTLFAGVLALAMCIAIAAMIRTWNLQSQLDDMQKELDHTHSLTHGLGAALIAHLEGREITLHPIRLRDTDKE